MRLRNKYGVLHPTAPGLVLDLPMSERSGSKVYDRSGKDNHGTIHGATWAVSEKGAGLSFDGDNDYVDCGNDASLNIVDAITIEAWVKPNLTDDMSIVSNFNALGTRAQYDFRVQDDGKLRFLSNDGTVYSKITTDVAVLDGAWSYVAITNTLASLTFFVDGIEFENFVYAIMQTPSPGKSSIGRAGDYDGLYFCGIIDELRIFNRVLSEEEIKRRYEQPKYDYLRSK